MNLKKDLAACGEMNLIVLKACRVCAKSPLFKSMPECWNTQSFYFDRKGVSHCFIKCDTMGFSKEIDLA